MFQDPEGHIAQMCEEYLKYVNSTKNGGFTLFLLYSSLCLSISLCLQINLQIFSLLKIFQKNGST